jgi:hypothetical protein
MMRWVTIVATVATVSGTAAHVDAKTNRYLKRARKAYQNLDYTRVTPLLNRALKAATTDREKVEIHYLLGTMHTIYSRERQAVEAFTELLTLQPTYELPPDISPKIRTAFAEARETVPAGGRTGPPTASEEPPSAADQESVTGDAYETNEAFAVEDTHAVNAGVFGPTDGRVPGLTARSHGSPWYRQWWVWTIVGVVVAGGTGYLLYSLEQVEYPNHTHGPYPLR